LILSDGGPRGPGATTAVLRRILADSGRFDVRVCESADGLSASTLAPFDLVVAATGLARGGETEKAVAAFVAEGKGLVITQGALDPSGDWPRTSRGGPSRPVRFLDVKVARPDHPIVRGMNVAFRTPDSVPGGLAARPGAEVIATVDGEGGPVPVL